MTLQDIIKQTKEVELGEKVIKGIDNSQVHKTINKLYSYYLKDKEDMYAVIKNGTKIQINELLLEYIEAKNTKQMDYYYKTQPENVMLNNIEKIQEAFTQLTLPQIKKLMIDYTLSEILGGQFDSKGNFQPKDIFENNTKEYLYNNN